MTNHALAAILDILSLEPAHDATRIELERIVRRARLVGADTEVPAVREAKTPTHATRCPVIFE